MTSTRCAIGFALVFSLVDAGCAHEESARSETSETGAVSTAAVSTTTSVTPVLTDAEEIELVALVQRSLVSDEETKSLAQDEGRFLVLMNQLTTDLVTPAQKTAPQCLLAQQKARAALMKIFARAKDARVTTFDDLIAGATPEYAVVIRELPTNDGQDRPTFVVATATGTPGSLVEHDAWTLHSSGLLENVRPGCAAPLTEAERAAAATIAQERLLDVIRRHEPELAALMVENQRLKACMKVMRQAKTRLRLLFIAQEVFHADHGRFALYAELPKEALPSAKELERFQFDLVDVGPETFTLRATGRGETTAAGALLEIDRLGVTREILSPCSDVTP